MRRRMRRSRSQLQLRSELIKDTAELHKQIWPQVLRKASVNDQF